MGFFERRKQQKRLKDYHERQMERLEQTLERLEPGTEQYDRTLMEIDKVYAHQAAHKEVHSKMSEHTKKMVIGAACLTGILGVNYLLESKGIILTGQNRKNNENLLSNAVANFTRVKLL